MGVQLSAPVSEGRRFSEFLIQSEEFKTIYSFGRLATVAAWVVFDMYLNVLSSLGKTAPHL
jgi:hypothetical protein